MTTTSPTTVSPESLEDIDNKIFETFGNHPSVQTRKRLHQQIRDGVFPLGLLDIICTVRTCGELVEFGADGQPAPAPLFRPDTGDPMDKYVPNNPRRLSAKPRETMKFLGETYLPELATSIQKTLERLDMSTHLALKAVVREIAGLNESPYSWLADSINDESSTDPKPTSPLWARALVCYSMRPKTFNRPTLCRASLARVAESIYLSTYIFPKGFVEAVGLEWEPKPDDREAEIDYLKRLKTWAWDASTWLNTAYASSNQLTL